MGHAEPRLASKDFAYSRNAGDIPSVGNARAVLSSGAVNATAAAEIDILLSINTGPGAGRKAIRHVADRLSSSTGQSLRAPAAGCYIGIDIVGTVTLVRLTAVVVVAIAMRRFRSARFSWLLAALIIIIPVSIVALRIARVVGVLGDAAIEVIVPFPFTWATLVMRRRRGVV